MRGLVGAISPMLAQGGQAMAAKMAPAPAPQRRGGILQGFNPLRFESNGMSGSERLMGIGALLADLGGGQGNVAAVQQMRQQQAVQAQENALRQQIAGTIEDPVMRAAAMANPQAWAESYSYNARPTVVATGSAQVRDGRVLYEQPRTVETGDQIVAVDSGGVRPLYERQSPSIDETIRKQQADTATFSAQSGAEVARGRLDLDRQNSGFTLSGGQIRFGADGQPIAEVEAAPRAPSAQESEARGQLSSLQTDVQPTLSQMRQLVQSGDVITGFGAQARLQAARALAATGNEQARREVAATEQYVNLSGRLRVGMAKSLGANPSNADILLLERVTAGDIGQSADGLLATINDGDAFAQRQMQALASRIPQPETPRQAPAQHQAPAQGPTLEQLIAERERRRRGGQ